MTDDLRRIANELDAEGTHISDRELLVLLTGVRREIMELYPGIPEKKIIRAFLSVAVAMALEVGHPIKQMLSDIRAAAQNRIDRSLPEPNRIITPDRMNDLKQRNRANGG